MSFQLTKNDRVLFVAPHPDDESLATGGLIQRANRAGAAARVLFVTNGDNNPWPQRWVEKRWSIGDDERQRWGGLRRREALQALRRLGLPSSSGRFLNFPDQGISDKLLRADREALERICRELKEFKPTLLVLPSAYDLHPDHNALHVLFQIALGRLRLPAARQLQFLVHCRRPDLVPKRLELHLREEERRLKREAILCHQTQMVLSRKRFLAYARPVEAYFEKAPARELVNGHRIREAYISAGALNLTITLSTRHWAGTALFVAAESPAGSLRWRLPLPMTTRQARFHDTITGQALRLATVRVSGRAAVVKIPIAVWQPLSHVFVKLHRRTLFLDEAGWREVPLPSPAMVDATVPTAGWL